MRHTMTTTVYTPSDDGPGPITVDATPDASRYVVHGAYGTARITNELRGGTTTDTHLALTWTQAAPYQVAASFTHLITGHTVRWTLARHLLCHAGSPVNGGQGNITVWHGLRQVWIELDTPHGKGTVSLDKEWLTRFLTTTDELAPTTGEWDQVQVPDTVAELFDHGGW